MKVLVCGGRDYKDHPAVFRALDALHKKVGIKLIIQGGAKGADSLAGQWAEKREIPCVRHPAEWGKYGITSGPIRNAAMLKEWKPDGVMAFPGGEGTKNMVAQAEKAGVKVWKPYG
jgi:hypothetical protein